MMIASDLKKNDLTTVPDAEYIRKRALAAYLGVAIGDALGATVEFMTPGEIENKHALHCDMVGGGWLHLKPGQVTDDTEMSLALGDAILADPSIKGEVIAKHFSEWMASKPKDIGHTVRRGLIDFRRTGQWKQQPNPEAAGNGACMRIAPLVIAMLGAPWRHVRYALHVQNHITHNASLSDAACETVAHMIQASILGQANKDGLVDIAEGLATEHPDFAFGGRMETNPSGFIVHTMKAVFQGLRDTNNFEDCLVNVVNRGGDADTTGAIAGMIAGAHYGLVGIPPRWMEGLDPMIHDRVSDQTLKLLTIAPISQRQPG